MKEIHLIRSIFSIVSSVINAADRETSIVKKLCSICAVKRRAGCVGQVFLVFGEGEELMAVSGESQYRGCRLSGGRRVVARLGIENGRLQETTSDEERG